MRPTNPARLFVPFSPNDHRLELLHRLRDPVERARTGLFVADGVRFLFKALDANAPIEYVVLCPGLLPFSSRAQIACRLKEAGIDAITVPQERFITFAGGSEHLGILLVIRQNWSRLPSSVSRNDLWLGIEHLRTHGNLGTLMRSAVAVGATGLMVFGPRRDRTDPFDETAVRASMGAIFNLKMVSCTHAEFRTWPRRSEVAVLGATGEAETDFRSVSYRRPVVLMVGNERKGLSDAQRSTCNGFIRIPMVPGIDSLNVAMAGTVLLYEAYGQRHPTKRSRPK